MAALVVVEVARGGKRGFDRNLRLCSSLSALNAGG